MFPYSLMGSTGRFRGCSDSYLAGGSAVISMDRSQMISNAHSEAAEQIVPSGISGLDYCLSGGFPANPLFLVEGDPGTGKTTLALQYLLNGQARGEKGLYVTLSETKA